MPPCIRRIFKTAPSTTSGVGVLVLTTLFGMCPFLEKLFADGGYQWQAFRKAAAKMLPYLKIEIVKRSDHAKGFQILPQRWVVERTFACSPFTTPSNYV
jgi:hypothetical protein